MGSITDFINTNKDRYIDELKHFLSYPSISTNPENRKDVVECAEYIEEHLKKMGFDNVTIYPTKGHPIVYADWLKAGADKPTILIYGHYDVQPLTLLICDVTAV
jgi:acetylornithine deacetylase/succinyl-diaminopimelate desuccinylase-like protein